MPVRSEITGLLLAGGQGSRMGGADKGMVPFHGRPLAAWVLERLEPQVGRVLISANRNPDAYAALGAGVIPDRLGGFPGPLAGVEAGLSAMTTPWLATCPCDSPFLPTDLVTRLAAAASEGNARMAVARVAGHLQPAFMLCHASVLKGLQAWLEAGERRVGAWQKSMAAVPVDFDDCPEAFANFNTPEELASQAMRR